MNTILLSTLLFHALGTVAIVLGSAMSALKRTHWEAA